MPVGYDYLLLICYIFILLIGNNRTRSHNTHHKRKKKSGKPKLKRQNQIKGPRCNPAQDEQFADKETLQDIITTGDNRDIDDENVAAITLRKSVSSSWETQPKDYRTDCNDAKMTKHSQTNKGDDSRSSTISRWVDEFRFKDDDVNREAIRSKAGATDTVKWK